MTEITLPYFLARPVGEDGGPGVVVIHEGNGISSQLLRVCQRLAHEGYVAMAPDLFFRAGGTEARDVVSLMGSITAEQTAADVDEAVARLRDLGAGAVAVMGFCMGGLLAYRTALRSPGCDAAVGFYGARIAAELGAPRCPTLLFFGGDDEYIPPADIEAVVAHHDDTAVYPRAQHGFMRDRSPSYDDEAASDAWRRTIEFLGRHLGESDDREKA
jgi:carboxymethylenebutenolidase